MTTTKNNESCTICGDPLAGGHVEIRKGDGYQKVCFSCALVQLEITNALTEIEMEDEE